MSWRTANAQPERVLDFEALEPSEAVSWIGNLAEMDVMVTVKIKNLLKAAGLPDTVVNQVGDELIYPISVLSNVTVTEGRNGNLWVKPQSIYIGSDNQTPEQQIANEGKAMYVPTWTPVFVTQDGEPAVSNRTLNALSSVCKAVIEADLPEEVAEMNEPLAEDDEIPF